jgi:hypothetical protein
MKRLTYTLGLLSMFVLIIVALLIVGGSFYAPLPTAEAAERTLPGSGWWQGFLYGNWQIEFDPPGENIWWQEGDPLMVAIDGDQTTYTSSEIITKQEIAWLYHPGLSANCTDTTEPIEPNLGCRIDMSTPSGADWGWKFELDNWVDNWAVGTIKSNTSGSVGVSGGKAQGHYNVPDVEIPGYGGDIPVVFGDYGGISTYIRLTQFDGVNHEKDLVVDVYLERNDGEEKYTTHTVLRNDSLLLAPIDYDLGDCNGGTGSGFNSEDCVGNVFFTADVDTGEYPVLYATVLHLDESASTPTWIAAHSSLESDNDVEGNQYLPSMKNSYYADDATTVAYVSSRTTTQSLQMKFTVTGVESGCSGVSVGDTFTDTLTVPEGSVREISYAAGTVGDVPNCVSYTAIIDDVNQIREFDDIPTVVIETQSSGSTVRRSAYVGQNVYNPRGGMILNFPLYKEDFSDAQGAIDVMSVGDIGPAATHELGDCTEVDAYFYEGSNEYHLRTDEICPGEAVQLRRISDGDSGKPWTEISGGTPPDNKKYFVALKPVESTDDVRIAAIYRSASYDTSTVLDISAVGANQEIWCDNHSENHNWCE